MAARSIRRTILIALATWAVVPFGRHTRAQSKKALPLVVWLHTGSAKSGISVLAAFKDGLSSFGLRDGAQILLEEYWADGRIENLPLLAQQIAAKNPAVIVAASSQAVAAAAKAASTIPIVHATGSDPVAAGFAASLAHPGGMITGLTNVVTDLQEKFVELLLAAVPELRRIGFLVDTTTFSRSRLVEAARRSASQYSIEAFIAEVKKVDEIDSAFRRLAKESSQALAVLSSPFLTFERKRIVTLALANRWPVIAGGRGFVEEGALLGYFADTAAMYRRAAYYVDQILKGARPGNLPFEQPTRFELWANLKTAKALGLRLPQSLLLRADKVIEG